LRPTDQEIVADVRAGNREAFRVLVERHRDTVFGILMRLVADRDLAEELAQEAFVRAYTGLAGYRGEARFSTWLVQIGLHLCRDRLRWSHRKGRDRMVPLDGGRDGTGPALEVVDLRPGSDPGLVLEGRETEALIRGALDALSPEYREVLVLKHLEGWSYERIAEVTGATVGTLKVRAHRARRLLREKMMEGGWEPPGDLADDPRPDERRGGGS
jgi:RNA polymerase sigma-70 factor (ECF subfamily)